MLKKHKLSQLTHYEIDHLNTLLSTKERQSLTTLREQKSFGALQAQDELTFFRRSGHHQSMQLQKALMEGGIGFSILPDHRAEHRAMNIGSSFRSRKISDIRAYEKLNFLLLEILRK